MRLELVVFCWISVSSLATASQIDPFATVTHIEPQVVESPDALPMIEESSVAVVTQSHEAIEPIEFAVIPLKHTNSDAVAKICQPEQGGGLLTSQGRLSVDIRSNSLIVMDTSSAIERIRRLVTQIDVPVQQIEIEARIVVMKEGALDEIGVRWGILDQGTTLPIGGSMAGSIDESLSSERMNQQLAINLPATSSNASSLAFRLATLGSGLLLDLELSALQSESKAEVISSPRLLTTNRQTAYIEQGTEIPYQESNADGEATVSFKKAVLSLEVTPYLGDHDQFVLDLTVTQDQPGDVVRMGTGEALAITTQRMTTQVKAQNGETIVLGGIQQQSTTNSSDKVPLLGDLPLLGQLFRRDYQQVSKSELLIFVTPTLLIQ
jgi:type IV pilus assembly protein PilQ